MSSNKALEQILQGLLVHERKVAMENLDAIKQAYSQGGEYQAIKVLQRLLDGPDPMMITVFPITYEGEFKEMRQREREEIQKLFDSINTMSEDVETEDELPPASSASA